MYNPFLLVNRMNTLPLTDKPSVPGALFHKKMKNNHLLVHPDRPAWTLVNDFGWDVVSLLDGKNSLADIIERLLSEYDVSRHDLTRDITSFIDGLRKAGLLDDSDHMPRKGRTIQFSDCFIHITDTCNLKCSHCYYPDEKKAPKKPCSAEIIQFLEEFHRQGGSSVTISGGEPLLYKDVLREIISAHAELAFKVLTNGTLIDAEIADFFREYRVNVQVSLDGSEAAIHDGIRGKGAFEAAIQGIKLLAENGLGDEITISTTIMSSNLHDLKNILALAKELNVSFVRFLPLRKEGRACSSWSDLNRNVSLAQCEEFNEYVFEKAHEEYPGMRISTGLCGFVLDKNEFNEYGHWCSIGKSIIIDVNGAIYPCVMLMQEEYCLGTLAGNSMEDFRKSPVLQGLLNVMDERPDKNESCRTCMWKRYCQSGCMGLALERYDSLDHQDELCSYKKKLYDASIEKIITGKPPYKNTDDTKCR